MAAVRTPALILRSVDVFETSRVLTLYSRALGKVSALAKGARRLRSPFRSALDLLSHCDVVLLHKGTESLDLLTEAELIERFDAPRRDLNALYAACYVAELLDSLTDHAPPHPRLHDAAVVTLRHLDDAALRGRRVMRFELACLGEMGHMPSWEQCAGCGRAVDVERRPVGFGPATGGLLCPECQPRQPHATTIAPPALAILRALARPGPEWRELEPAPRALLQARAALGAVVSHTLGRRPRLLDRVESAPPG